MRACSWARWGAPAPVAYSTLSGYLVCVCVCVSYACIRIYMYMYVCMCVYTHTHTHTHTLCRLKHGKGSMMAIFDATNTTRERRRRVLERVMKEPGVSGNTQL